MFTSLKYMQETILQRSMVTNTVNSKEEYTPLLTKVIFVNRLKRVRKKLGVWRDDVTNHI